MLELALPWWGNQPSVPQICSIWLQLLLAQAISEATRKATCSILLALAADDFPIKYKGKAGAEHLAAALPACCKATASWEGKLRSGAALGWGCEAQAARCSALGYAGPAL